MSVATVISGVLCVGSALPDPPFEFMDGDTARGFDVELMKAIAAELGLQWRLVPYAGGDFNGIFAGLANGAFDCIASGATITPERERMAAFCAPDPAKAWSATPRQPRMSARLTIWAA